jgi:basic membrane protein A and related proteins
MQGIMYHVVRLRGPVRFPEVALSRFGERCMHFPLRAPVVCAALVVFLSACGSSASPSPTATPTSGPPLPTVGVLQSSPVPASRFQAGLVTDVGGLGDRSFNDLAWAGIRAVERNNHIRGTVLQSKTEADYAPNLVKMAKRHVSLIVAVGASMGQAMYKVAGRYPKQRFALVDARPMKTPGQEIAVENVANILFDEQDAGYVAGTLAGLLAHQRVGNVRHNAIGYLGGFPIPQVDRYLAGYVAGARHVDPGVKIIGQYAGSFSSAAKGRSIGLAQIGQGAGVLFQVASATGTGYVHAAGAKHVYAIGVDANQSYLGPEVIASAVKRVDVATESVVHADQMGRFRPGDNVFGAANGGTGLTGLSPVIPHSVVAQVAKYQVEVARGTVVPPVAIPAR